ncbi:hypothetical protein [Escherichia phage BI-EHEC]|nr:hypothetical protein [Escherichia phage BI-EHEC]
MLCIFHILHEVTSNRIPVEIFIDEIDHTRFTACHNGRCEVSELHEYTRLALARVCTRSVLAKYKDTVFIFDISISSLAICYARYANHYTDIFIQCKHYLHLQCDLSPIEDVTCWYDTPSLYTLKGNPCNPH